jgi:hypothetical protein
MHASLRHAKIFALLGLLLAGNGSSVSAPPEPAGPPARQAPAGDLGPQLDRFLERTATFGFSGQVVLARGGNVLLDGAYGFAEQTPDLAALGGTYSLAGGDRLHLFHDGASLWIAAEGQTAADLLLGTGARQAAGLDRAIARTSRLYTGLVLGRREAYLDALGEDGRGAIDDYWSEWTGLVERRGALRSFRVLGARPAYGSASVATVLRFSPGGVVVMNSLWADGGTGRLHGTLVHRRPATPMPFPAAYPVARRDGDHLVAFDPFPEHGVAITVEQRDGALRLDLTPLEGGETVTARPVGELLPGTDGWVPRSRAE